MTSILTRPFSGNSTANPDSRPLRTPVPSGRRQPSRSQREKYNDVEPESSEYGTDSVLIKLLIAFITIPLVEMFVLGILSDTAGLPFTILLVLFTGCVGFALARRQGLIAWRRIHHALAQGKTPAAEVLDAVLILLAGAVLITPGLLTDTFGFLLLVPRFRRWLGKYLSVWFRNHTVARFTGTTVTSGDTLYPQAEDDELDESPEVRVVDPAASRIDESSHRAG